MGRASSKESAPGKACEFALTSLNALWCRVLLLSDWMMRQDVDLHFRLIATGQFGHHLDQSWGSALKLYLLTAFRPQPFLHVQIQLQYTELCTDARYL
eukprot:6176049-Pleurochrysis_carterae.AAC.1